MLFAGQFAVEAAESDAECLESTQWIAEVQSEDVFRHSSKLHNDVVHYTRHSLLMIELH